MNGVHFMSAPASPMSDSGRPLEGSSFASGWASLSAWISFLAGLLSAFTITAIGEMPVGELVLIAAAGWALVCLAQHRVWPGPLMRRRFFGGLLAAQGIALLSYIVADLYNNSAPRDLARGWARMIFLAIDIVAVAYLFGRARRNFIVFLFGLALGEVAHALIFGPLFDDMWKFGVGMPLTYLAFFLAGRLGRVVAILACAAMGLLHFGLDYRSLGALCLVAAMLITLQGAPASFRWWLAPLAAVMAGLAVAWTYAQMENDDTRATRSDVERSAMVSAALEAFVQSPLIGHGSWFSNSRVYDNFMEIRQEKAREAHVGGFADPNTEPGDVTLHSQLLVALAEGGLFGGAFFFIFGAGMLSTLYDIVFIESWRRLSPLYILVLLSGLWNLFFSPFSGAHRVYIALVCGIMLMQAAKRVETTEDFTA